jgi:hypothetical protein
VKVLVYLQGTIIMHKSGKDKIPQERRKQVLDKSDETIFDFENYIPINKANDILTKWKMKGIDIVYMSSHRNKKDLNKDIKVLEKYNFPKGEILYRDFFHRYNSLIKKELPDIIIEDDCASIGNWIRERYKFIPETIVNFLKRREMIYPCLDYKIKQNIKSIVIEEFSGIENINLI